ncbi:tetratricopeptide repeat family protein, partial [Vibrio cholerae HC-17A1]
MKWFRFPIAVIGLVLLSGCATQNESA